MWGITGAPLENAYRHEMNGRRHGENHGKDASVFLAKLLGDVAPNYMELRSPCGAGVGQMAFTASGDVYTCVPCDLLRIAAGNAADMLRLRLSAVLRRASGGQLCAGGQSVRICAEQ